MTKPCSNETDAELVERTRAGDERAAARLVRRHVGAIRQVFTSKISDSDVVDDLTQDVLLVCFCRLSALARPECFRSWAVSIALHKLHDYFRANARMRARLVDVEHPREWGCEGSDAASGAIEAGDEARVLAAALARISRRSQLLVLQYYWHELPRTEIAAALGIPVGTVGSRLAYARKQLGAMISTIESTPNEHVWTGASIGRWREMLGDGNPEVDTI